MLQRSYQYFYSILTSLLFFMSNKSVSNDIGPSTGGSERYTVA